MAGDKPAKLLGRVIDELKGLLSMWIGEEIPTLDEWWHLENNDYVYENHSRHMVKSGRRQALANLLSHVRWTLRQVKMSG